MIFQLLLSFLITSNPAGDTIDLDRNFTELLFRGSPGQRTWLWRPFFKSPFQRQGTVIRTDSSLLYFVDQYGVVYEINQVQHDYTIRRIDRTISSGFTTQAYIFHSKQNNFSFGGYGFWQTNGQLRIFLPERGDWEIVKLNANLPSFNRLTFFDKETSTLWLAQQDYLLEGFKDVSRREDHKVFRCSTENPTWIEEGKLIEHPGRIMGWPFHFLLETPYGVLVANDQVNYEIWSFARNQKYSLESASNTLRLKFSHLNNYGYSDYSMLWLSDTIVIYDHHQKRRVGNIPLKPAQLKVMDTLVYQKNSNQLIWYSAGSILLVTIIFTGFLAFKKRKPSNSKYPSENLVAAAAMDFFLNSMNVEEIAVFSFLSNTSNPTFSADVHQLNDIIGLQDKSFDVQKNKRSEVIAGINQKFSAAFREREPLVLRIRSVQDKRSFIYTLNNKLRTMIASSGA